MYLAFKATFFMKNRIFYKANPPSVEKNIFCMEKCTGVLKNASLAEKKAFFIKNLSFVWQKPKKMYLLLKKSIFYNLWFKKSIFCLNKGIFSRKKQFLYKRKYLLHVKQSYFLKKLYLLLEKTVFI